MLNHVLFRNGHLSYEQMSCCLSRKINTSEKNQNEIFWLIHFTLSKRSVKSIKLLLCRGCPALYSSVEKLSFYNVLPVLNFSKDETFLKENPFHSSSFHGIICGRLKGSLAVEDHLRSILGIICGLGSFAVLYMYFYSTKVKNEQTENKIVYTFLWCFQSYLFNYTTTERLHSLAANSTWFKSLKWRSVFRTPARVLKALTIKEFGKHQNHTPCQYTRTLSRF